MTRSRIAIALTLTLLALASSPIQADVKTDEKGRAEFTGLLGRMVNIFGGKAAREGVTTTRAVKGDRMATLSEAAGQIIDLGEEKIYDLDVRKKTYKVTTFAELRRQMEDAKRKAEASARKEEGKSKDTSEPARNPDGKDLDIDFDVKNTGQRKSINGFDTHQAVMTITLREKGKTLDESGGMVLTSDMWLAPRIAAMNEIGEFHARYAQQLAGPTVAGASAEDMAAAMAMYPMMKQAIARMNAENVKLEGTAIQTIVKLDAVKSAAQVAEEQKSGDADSKVSPSGGIGGLMGGLARRAARPKTEGESGPGTRANVMTITTEVLKVTSDVGPAEVAIPVGFKENR